MGYERAAQPCASARRPVGAGGRGGTEGKRGRRRSGERATEGEATSRPPTQSSFWVAGCGCRASRRVDSAASARTGMGPFVIARVYTIAPDVGRKDSRARPRAESPQIRGVVTHVRRTQEDCSTWRWRFTRWQERESTEGRDQAHAELYESDMTELGEPNDRSAPTCRARSVKALVRAF